jgi:hypothetical protein
MHMTWKVQLNAELGFIHIVHSGTVTEQDSKDATAEALALAQGNGPHLFLSDILDAESQLSTLDIYDKPSEWEALGLNRANKLALVVPEGGKTWEDARFYANTCRNQGWQVTVFSQRQEAIDWLTGHHPSNKPDAGDG